jgi:F-type H+-transporting ATPase subunit gamma
VAGLRDIKRRIVSVESTQKITSAMKMVSAAKLRRAQDAIESARPYAERMKSTLEEVAGAGGDASHPLLEQREERKTLEVVVVTSDRGLAGAFNGNVIKAANAMMEQRSGEFENTRLTLIGKKAVDHYRRRRAADITHASDVGSDVNYPEAQEIARGLMDRFEKGEVDEVVLVFSEFVSTMTQTPVVVPLLPFVPPEVPEGEKASDEEEKLAYEIEPDPAKLLAVLVPKAVEVSVYRALLENQAGEHAARMTAMENATRNSEELIETLTLQFNRARQAAITTELVEIVTGAQALE